jgi:hypothetical protein
MHHFVTELKHDKKWRTMNYMRFLGEELQELVGDAIDVNSHDEDSSDEGKKGPTHNSVAKTERPGKKSMHVKEKHKV